MNLKKILLSVAAIALLANFASTYEVSKSKTDDQQATKLTLKWQSVESGLDTPESVLHDENNHVIYVSNVNSFASGANWQDNGGYLSKLDETGSVINAKWVKGLKAPKGLIVNDDKLYVADLDTVAVIDTKTGRILNTYNAPDGADHLNDIIYDQSSNKVYVSDSADKIIYEIDSAGKFTVFYTAETASTYQNGLFLDDKNIIMAGSKGTIKSINTSDGSVSTIATGITGSIDGIWKYNSTGFIVSVWEGGIYYVGYDGDVKELIASAPKRTADSSYSNKLKLLLVPDFKDKIIAYSVN